MNIAQCEEGAASILALHPQAQELAKDAISVKIVPTGSRANAAYDDLAVVAKPGTSVVAALNDYLELSFEYTGDKDAAVNRAGYANLDNWIGSDVAKARLKNSCGQDKLKGWPVVYQGCGNGGGMHIWSSRFQWQWNSVSMGQDIEIYFGYAMGGPTPAPTAEPTVYNKNPVIELPWSTDRVQQWADVWIVNSDTSLTGTGTLLDE